MIDAKRGEREKALDQSAVDVAIAVGNSSTRDLSLNRVRLHDKLQEMSDEGEVDNTCHLSTWLTANLWNSYDTETNYNEDCCINENSPPELVFKKPFDVRQKKKVLSDRVSEISSSFTCLSEFDTELMNRAVRGNRVKILKLDNLVGVKRLFAKDVYVHANMVNGANQPLPGVYDVGSSTGCSQISNRLCPGCQPPKDLRLPLLTSRTINHVLDTSPDTCQLHRDIRRQEKRCQGSVIKRQKQETTIKQPRLVLNELSTNQSVSSFSRRRARVPYTQKEVKNLLSGVSQLGRCWGRILHTYEFHPIRSASDLKDKYKRLQQSTDHSVSSSIRRRARVPYSETEVMNLLKGVSELGHCWGVILRSYKFHPIRVPSDLKDKYKRLKLAESDSSSKMILK